MLKWTIYEVTGGHTLHGVKFRGRLRVYGSDHKIDLLAENASDADNTVRFAILDKANLPGIKNMIESVIPDASIIEAMRDIENPVLSKMKVNLHERYRED